MTPHARRTLAMILLTASCGAMPGRPAHQVDSSLVGAFPTDARRWTYEAENEVIVALDRRDDVELALARAEVNLREADAAIARAREAGRPTAAAEAQRRVAERGRASAERDLAQSAIAVTCARTALELTKARLVVSLELPAPGDYVATFDAQHAACAARLEAARAELEAVNRQLLEAKAEWRRIWSEQARQTGDYDHGLWID